MESAIMNYPPAKHRRSIFFRFLCMAAAIVLLSGCTPAVSQVDTAAPTPSPAQATPTPTPQPTPELTPAPASAADIKAAFSRQWAAQPRMDIASYIPDTDATTRFLSGPASGRQWLLELRAALEKRMDAALDEAVAAASAETGAAISLTEKALALPPWQMLFVILESAGTPDAAGEYLWHALMPALTLTPDRAGGWQCQAANAALDYTDVLTELHADSSSTFLYRYILTIYDENACEIDYVERPAGGNLASGITWPLASHTRLRKTWYAQRDGGSRKHTGTDIWANAGTDIYSCTDGTVTYVDYNEGMGNAVIVKDAYGYEFHYYHMIRLTDFLQVGDAVKAGELLGHVGNTGNSSRDHLHLTIVAPDGYFINPYPYLKEIEPKIK